jgi:hypothetical protein
MLEQVILQSSTPMTLDIANADPDEPIILESISGLTPGDVTLFTGDYSGPGGYYQGRRDNKRNPIFKLKLNPDYAGDISVSDLREGLYRVFYEPQALTDGLQVTVKDDRKPDRYFICYAEKWDGEIFEKSPKAGISTVCVDPYLRSVDETTDSDAGWVSTTIDYDGSADTGIEVSLKVTSLTANVRFSIGGQFMTLAKGSNFAINDVIVINTNDGSRQVTVNGVDRMAYLTAASQWLVLGQASNVITADGGVAADGKAVITEYTFRSAWRGV